jgi:UDP-N-acetylmuramoylalanine--D-glutamate ligase
MVDFPGDRLTKKKALILGFGREGQSTYSVIRKAFPGMILAIADRDESIASNPVLSGDPRVELHLGPDYLDRLDTWDVIIKSPGITLKDLPVPPEPGRITSQTDLFLEAYSSQVIGVTGTKGKSTTSSLIRHILSLAGKETALVGNIGTPAFHFLDQIRPETFVVYELSSHQLEHVRRGPHIAILLNFFQEHLDAYSSFRAYRLAKMNILRGQVSADAYIFNSDDPLVMEHTAEEPCRQIRFPFSLGRSFPTGCFRTDNQVVVCIAGERKAVFREFHNKYLRGEHNIRNIMAAISAGIMLRIDPEIISESVETFKGLEHRMEYSGEWKGIRFYNDSIATIPEATMAAIKSIPGVDTLILGGFDRGIDYRPLAEFLVGTGITNIILTGEAGRRIGEELEKAGRGDKKIFSVSRFDDFPDIAFARTKKGGVCLLSPAAASYDEFQSFEERGKRFKTLVKPERTNPPDNS